MVNRRYEQGGVVSFLIVAVVLAALLGAGIWWANKSQTVVTSNASNKAGEQKSIGTGATSTKEGDSSTGTSTEKPAAGTTTDSATPNASSEPNNVASTGPSVSELPSAGPADVLVTGLSLSAVGAGAYYLAQSRGRVRGAALK